MNDSDFTIEDVYSNYKGIPSRKEVGLIEMYNRYLKRIEKLIDKEIKLVTYKKYKESLIHLKIL